MKLGEAILERDGLEERLKRLESRLLEDNETGRPQSRLQEDLQLVANRVRDLSIAISWTECQATLYGLPLMAYRSRIEMLYRLASCWESMDREKADALWASAHNDRKVLEASTWLIDLQVPKITPTPEAKQDEEVEK